MNNPDHNDSPTGQEQTAVKLLVDETVKSPEAVEEVDIDTIFEVLSHPGRRYVLTYLLQSTEFASMSELVDYVIEQTNHSMTDRQFRHRVTVELTHTHLPKLEEEGFVNYNIERQIVSPTDQTPLTSPYLRTALEQQKLINETLDQ